MNQRSQAPTGLAGASRLGNGASGLLNGGRSESDREPLLLEESFTSGHLTSAGGESAEKSFEYRWMASETGICSSVDNHQHRHPLTIAEEQRMTLEQSICEDLRAFETRLTDIVSELHPPTRRWQLLLIFALLCALFGAGQVLADEEAYSSSLLATSCRHLFATASLLLLLSLFFPPIAIHRRIGAPSIIRARIQEVIAQFNMSCDDRGRLILMPHPRSFMIDQQAEDAAAAAYEEERQRRRASAVAAGGGRFVPFHDSKSEGCT